MWWWCCYSSVSSVGDRGGRPTTVGGGLAGVRLGGNERAAAELVVLVTVEDRNVMALSRQCVTMLDEARFEIHGVVDGRGAGHAVDPSRVINGLLEVAAPIDDVDEHLHIGLDLPAPSGRGPGDHAAVCALDDVGVQRVHRSLVAGKPVGVRRVYDEIG